MGYTGYIYKITNNINGKSYIGKYGWSKSTGGYIWKFKDNMEEKA